MKVTIRKFEKTDIVNKIKWINNPENNIYLHYDLPLMKDKTEGWFEKNKDSAERYDAVIEVDDIAVGIIGLLNIDKKNRKAEYYVTIGEKEYRGKGISVKATKLLIEYAFQRLGLNRIYLYVEKENISAIKSYERIGFRREGELCQDIFSKGHYVDRYVYGITKKRYYDWKETPVQLLGNLKNNTLYIKRDDLFPLCFGGNKSRKAKLFFEEIDQGKYDCIVTYGSCCSNHCRVISGLAASRGLKCYIISPQEILKKSYNLQMMNMFGAEITFVPVDEVHDAIDKKLADLIKQGLCPYFIAGGGHGNIGTQAYVNCFEEIHDFESKTGVQFDFIFHATGTGTTQAGLICGKLINYFG